MDPQKPLAFPPALFLTGCVVSILSNSISYLFFYLVSGVPPQAKHLTPKLGEGLITSDNVPKKAISIVNYEVCTYFIAD